MQCVADQRRAALAHGDRFGGLERQGGAITPEAARGGVDLVAGQAGQRRQQQWRVTGAAPARLVERVCFARARVEVGGGHAGSVRGRLLGLKGSRWNSANNSTRFYNMRRDEVLATLRAHGEELREGGVSALSLFGSVARDNGSLQVVWRDRRINE